MKKESNNYKLDRVYAFLKKFLNRSYSTEDELKAILDSCFEQKEYWALILGEITHNRKGEQTIAVELIDRIAEKFVPGTFVLREESNGIGGILSGAPSRAMVETIIKKHRIAAKVLPARSQYYPQEWIPELAKGTQKLITYTGYAHSDRVCRDYFSNVLPQKYILDPGKCVLPVVEANHKKGVAVAICLADEFLDDFELQAYREKLAGYPGDSDLSQWLESFHAGMTRFSELLMQTRIYQLRNDVFLMLVPPYNGLLYNKILEIAWSDERIGGFIREESDWELIRIWVYEDGSNSIQFNEKKPGKRFMVASVDVSKECLVGDPTFID